MISYIIIAILACILYLIVKAFLPYFMILKYKKKFGDQSDYYFFPFIGVFNQQLKSFQQYGDGYKLLARDTVKKNPEIKLFFTNFGTRFLILLYDPFYIKEMTINNNENYKVVYEILFCDLLIQNSVVLTIGDKWKKQRQILSQFFHFNDIQTRIPIYQQVCQEMVDSMQQFAQNKQLFNILQTAQTATSRMIMLTVLGPSFCELKINYKTITAEILQITTELCEASFRHRFTILRNLLWSYNYAQIPNWLLSSHEKKLLERLLKVRKIIMAEIDKVFNKLSNNSIEEISKEETQTLVYAFVKEMLNINCQNNNNKEEVVGLITKEDIIHNVFVLAIAATDTSAHVFTMCLYFLGKYPHYAEQIIKEIDANIPDYKNATSDQIKQLKFLQNFISETQRFYNPAPFSFRREAIKDHYLGSDLFIKKGQQLNVGILPAMSNSKFFKNPEQFQPERFADQLQEPFSFIPFLSGSRNCIGQHIGLIEVKLMLINFLKNFDFKMKEDYNLQIKLKFAYSPVDQEFLYIEKKRK